MNGTWWAEGAIDRSNRQEEGMQQQCDRKRPLILWN